MEDGTGSRKIHHSDSQMLSAAVNIGLPIESIQWNSNEGWANYEGIPFLTIIPSFVLLYTILFIATACHATTVTESAASLGLCLMMVILNASSALCSLILLIGLYKNNRMLLLPWTVSIAMTTLVDVMVSFYLIKDAVTDPFLAVVFVIDVLITAVNVYALLCVLSQYREFKTNDISDKACRERPEVLTQQPVTRTTMTTSIVTDEMTSSNAFLLQPQVSPNRSSNGLDGSANTAKAAAIACELTTISEEKPSSNRTPTPTTSAPITSNFPVDGTGVAETSFLTPSEVSNFL